jgi:hypothetical protein
MTVSNHSILIYKFLVSFLFSYLVARVQEGLRRQIEGWSTSCIEGHAKKDALSSFDQRRRVGPNLWWAEISVRRDYGCCSNVGDSERRGGFAN